MDIIIIYLFIFITGAAFGSFFNVCIWRIPLHQSIVSPRSKCPHCQQNIKPWHNIPIFSYIFLHGKCAYCGTKIKMNYLLVELLTPIIWMLLFWRFHNRFSWIFAKYIILYSVGLIIFFIDLYHKIIPDLLSLPLIIIGLGLSCISQIDLPFLSALAGAATGFFFFYLLALAVSHSLKREALGGGDIKFIAAIGAFIGIKGVLFTIFSSAAIALTVVLILKGEKSREIPYGPFLILGAFIHTIIGDWLLFIYFSLFF
ncbi:MAG: prepilin peptidase [Candidatus Cloacimonetes bacterium]|nr:prepilin peptidase [Candidatus Cloacimonadota bacterium]